MNDFKALWLFFFPPKPEPVVPPLEVALAHRLPPPFKPFASVEDEGVDNLRVVDGSVIWWMEKWRVSLYNEDGIFLGWLSRPVDGDFVPREYSSRGSARKALSRLRKVLNGPTNTD